MSLDELENRLDHLLNTRDSFYCERMGRRYYEKYLSGEQDTDVNKLTPTQVITKLHELDFNFTVDHFNKFIICAIYRKSISYIVKYIESEVIDIMFTKFTPSILQMKILFDCYKTSSTCYYYWIDTLVKKGYDFSKEFTKRLEDIGYDVSKLCIISSIKNGDIEYIFHNIKNWNVTDTLLEYSANHDRDNKLDNEPNKKNCSGSDSEDSCYSDNDYIWGEKKLVKLIDAIKNIIKKHKIILTTQHINIVISALSWYRANELKENISIIEMLLSDGCKLDIQCLYNLTNKTEYLDIFILLLKHINKEIPENSDSINVLKYVCQKGMWMHVLYLLKLGVKPDDEMLSIYFNKMSKHGMVGINMPEILNYPQNIIKKYGKGSTFNLYEYLIDLGAKPNNKILLHICESNDIEKFNKFIKIMVPTKECLDMVVGLGNIHMIIKILEHNIIVDIDTYNNLLHCMKETNIYDEDIETLKKIDEEKFRHISGEKLDLNLIFNYILNKLIDNGLKITENMAISAFKHKMLIFNLEHFGIEYNEDIFFNCNCYVNNMVSDKYYAHFVNNIGLHRMNLRTLNKISTKDEFIKYIKEYNIKPDRYCMDCALNNKKFIYEYMIHELKCEPLNYTLYKICIKEGMDPNSFILKEYKNGIKLTKNYMMQVYDHIDLDKI